MPKAVGPYIGGSSLNSEVTSLYRVEAVTSDFDTAKVGPFAFQDTAISGPRLYALRITYRYILLRSCFLESFFVIMLMFTL